MYFTSSILFFWLTASVGKCPKRNPPPRGLIAQESTCDSGSDHNKSKKKKSNQVSTRIPHLIVPVFFRLPQGPPVWGNSWLRNKVLYINEEERSESEWMKCRSRSRRSELPYRVNGRQFRRETPMHTEYRPVYNLK